MSTLRIGIPIYPTVDLIDVAAPWDVLSRIPEYWSGHSIEMLLIAETCDPVLSGQNLYLTPNHSFDDCEQLDVLLVPGTQQLEAGILTNERYRAFLQRQASGARWVTSVCTGAVVLAAAGLLDGYRATTHCLAIGMLEGYKGVVVANGYPRYVLCGNRFTTGGVSSSLDGALKLVEVLTGDAQVAKCIQLEIQYNPQPPYNDGDPAVADFETYDRVIGRKPPLHCT